MKRFLALLLAFGMVIQSAPTTISLAAETTGSDGKEYSASFVEKLENVLQTNISQYYDNSKIFRLPDGIDDDDEISIIISLDVITIMDAYEGTDKTMEFRDYALNSDDAKAINEDIQKEKEKILAELDEKGVKYSLGEEYNTVISGFELVIKAADFTDTCKSLGNGAQAIVGEEYYPAETKLVENSVSIYEDTGIIDGSTSGYDGSGMVVAVLDTGIDYNHTAFSTDYFTSERLGLTYEDVAAVIKETTANKLVSGITADDVYISEKIPFGFDYADEDADPYSTHNEHGTHVSGVIAGNDDVITGVAPNAQIVSMKIFSDVVDTAKTSWILSALEDCVVLGVDVINMSLGTSCGFSRESDEEAINGVYERIRETGISLIAAASNSYSSAYGSEANGNLGLTSNPDTGTVGSPSTYDGVMSVASISGTKTPYLLYNDTILYFLEVTNSASEEKSFFEDLLGDDTSKEFEYVVIPGVGRSADYSGLDVSGKIVLVRRGSNTFEEKAIIAEQQGAAGIIIYNNVSGDIKMNVGEVSIAACSISQDEGEMLAEKGGGKLKVSVSQTSGPFISDFSSWGPTPDLGIKPEITAYGGNILSAITGGSYDRMSGTSMACPNLAGTVVLLRQYVVENFEEIADDDLAVTAMIYQLLMSTADIALNKNGSPYAVRKQGAGLANLLSALNTTGYITTKDEDGNVMDKTKIELGDDKDKTGVYELNFTVNNIGDKKIVYDIGAYVMTEGVSDTKTNAGETTVTEESYILDGAKVEISNVTGGSVKGTKLTVKAGEQADVTVTITLTDENKAYLDESFENGMYVEGFITLTAVKGTDIDLSVPYLAFYGDWTEAPLFDLDYYETNADELDDGIDVEDKTMADAYATRPIGGVTQDYICYLGAYYFQQDPDDMPIAADRNYVALSNQDGTAHSLRYVWAGLLRNAAKVDITITNDATGEEVYKITDYDIRKSYGEGGSIYPSSVEIEFDTLDYTFANNTELTVKLVGYLDYDEDGGEDTNKNNTFEFPLAIDFEAPTVEDVNFYYEYDKTLKKNRLFAEVSVYDNQYAMCAQLGYVGWGEDENGDATPEITAFEQYMTPIYSEKNGLTTIKYELTDYIYEIKENSIAKNSFVVTTYDYALNYATYEIGLPDEFESFSVEGVEEGVTLSPNEIYSLETMVSPVTEWTELLEVASSKPSVVRVVNNKLVAVKSGKSIIRVTNPNTNESYSFEVTVLKEGDEGYQSFDKPSADIFNLTGYYTIKAYYILDGSEKDIGDTGSTNFFEGDYSLSMYPSESIGVQVDLDSYFPDDTEIVLESSNEEIVKADASGVITAVAEGYASVTVKLLLDGKSTYYSETISVEVKDPYVQTGPILTHYYGNGGLVTIPSDLSLTQIGDFAFANYEYVEKSEDELTEDDKELTKQWYIGDSSITKVIIPEGVEKIGAYAFANLTALTEIVLPSTLESIEYGAFYGCTSLEKITFSGENNLKIINQNAFENCALSGKLDLSSACVISDYAFAGNDMLEGVTTSDTLISIGSYAFAGCKKLTDVTITAKRVKYGTYAFTGCKALKEFTVNAVILPEGMFYECESLTHVTLGADVTDIGEFAFRDTVVSELTVADGNKTYKVQTADYVISADGKTLEAVAPTITGAFTTANIGGADVNKVGDGAFSHNRTINSVTLENVTVVGDYAFASNERLEEVTLGVLTEIGEYAFFETALAELPNFTADTSIGQYAFAYTAVTTVLIPDKMVVEEGVFSECSKLTTIVVGNDVVLGKYAFGTNKDDCFTIKNYNENDTKYFYYEFATALENVTIGSNVQIGEMAFFCAASLEKVELGENAKIDRMAFYNCTALKEIDLSKVVEIGEYAFSGDVYNICLDETMAYAAVSNVGTYIYTYHAPVLETVVLSNLTKIDGYAFAYCRELMDVTLNDEITEIPEYLFAGCCSLKNINLDKITAISDYAFMETALETADLSSTEEIGKYAFINCNALTAVVLNPNGTLLGEGAFASAINLSKVDNLAQVEQIGDWAFALTAIVSADLSGAVHIGTQAFLKEELTPFTVVLGEKLETLGDNPFAMCELATFATKGMIEINGIEVETILTSYEISDTVKVVDGALYSKVPNGWELIVYTGSNEEDVKVIDDTVRITSMAFAGTDVQMVTLPNTLEAIGHKAFYACDKLDTVVFTSFEAPALEEEYDSTYYDCLENIPGVGDFGTYVDYDGNEVEIVGMGLVPYYMWNVTSGMYTNVFYGANFVDYVGYVENKLVMVRPENGVNYDSYIMNQYFDLAIDGPTAPDDITMAAIRAIKAIPEKVAYSDKALVEAARDAYNKIATVAQQALVTNYADLVSAEQRIVALTPADDTTADVTAFVFDPAKFFLILLAIAVICGGVIAANRYNEQLKALLKKLMQKKSNASKTEEVEENETEN